MTTEERLKLPAKREELDRLRRELAQAWALHRSQGEVILQLEQLLRDERTITQMYRQKLAAQEAK